MSTIKPKHIFIFAFAYYFAVWILIIAVDVYNIFGIQNILIASNIEYPLLWIHMFDEASPTEMLVWLLLGLSIIVFSYNAGNYLYKNKHLSSFCIFMAIGLMLMLLEDAGNPSHKFNHWMHTLSIGPNWFNYRIIIFMFIGFFPLFAFVRYYKELLKVNKTRKYLLIGFFAYGIATLFSMADAFWGWYGSVGVFIHKQVLNELLILNDLDLWKLGWWFMDNVVEETLELIGAVALLASAISIWEERVVK